MSATVATVVGCAMSSSATVIVQLANASQQCAELGVSHGTLLSPCGMPVSFAPWLMAIVVCATDSFDACFAHTSSGPTIIRWNVNNVRKNPIRRRADMN